MDTQQSVHFPYESRERDKIILFDHNGHAHVARCHGPHPQHQSSSGCIIPTSIDLYTYFAERVVHTDFILRAV